MSHALPSFYLANFLKNEGYNVSYFTHYRKSLEDAISAAGFDYIKSTTDNIGYLGEKSYVEKKYRPANRFTKAIKIVNVLLRKEIYKERKKEILLILDRIKPSIVLIDVFSITNYLFFYPFSKHIQICLFSPMLSTRTSPGFPILSDRIWNKDKEYEKTRRRIHPLRKEFNIFNDLLDKWQMRRICKEVNLLELPDFDSNFFTRYQFQNVPEIILAPIELEVSTEVAYPDQHYLGLCIGDQLPSLKVDKRFNIDKIKSHKQNGKRVIFCSFGTYFKTLEEHKKITWFITNIIEAVSEISDVELIIAANDLVIKVIESTVLKKSNVSLYSFVPQLHLLNYTDIFITHCGLGSIKESIANGVPMLVCPLDEIWDNNGNAFKVEYHSIGIRADMALEEVSSLRSKIYELLSNNVYRQNVQALKDKISLKYTQKSTRDILLSTILNQNHYAEY